MKKEFQSPIINLNKSQGISETQEELSLIVERYNLAVEGSGGSIWDWDIASNKMYMSSSTIEKPVEKIVNIIADYETWRGLVHPMDLKQAEKVINAYLDKKAKYYRNEYRMKLDNGEYRWISSIGKAIWDSQGRPIRMAGIHTDITEAKKLEEKISHLAYYDALTGLPNRTLFEYKLKIALTNAKLNRKNEFICVICMDIDNLKVINDVRGHTFGDELLKAVGNMLRKNASANDVVARLGGDEFIIFAKHIPSLEGVKDKVESIKNLFCNAVIVQDIEININLTIGVSVHKNDADDVNSLIKNADTALYYAKKEKHRCMLYTPQMNVKILEKLKLEKELKSAIVKGELRVFYQPQVKIDTGEIIGTEALVRWLHPTEGMILPNNFIPLAEETGLIVSIGEIVLRTACSQNKLWQDSGHAPRKVSVNLSSRQFAEQSLVSTIDCVLKETGLDGKWLELEITESILMNNLESTIDILMKLKAMGVSIALDDFGTGFSSLNYLKKLPIDIIKIDKAFIDDINENNNDDAIARTIIYLAHSLQLEIVAEGVEREEQLNFLRKQYCNIVQGYIFSKPVPAEELYKNLIT